MSKRFGRTQRRELRELRELYSKQISWRMAAEQNVGLLISELQQARDVFLKLGWSPDCDVIKRIDATFGKLQNHYLGKGAN